MGGLIPCSLRKKLNIYLEETSVLFVILIIGFVCKGRGEFAFFKIEKLKTGVKNYKEKNRKDDDLKFRYIKCRSLNKKNEKII